MGRTCRRTDCVAKPLSGLFERLGSLVGSCPLYFLVIPLILSAALGGGFTFLKDREDNDFERQFTPRKGPSKATRAFVRGHFPYNDSMFSEHRLYDKGSFASLIAVSTSSSNILANPAFEDIVRLNNRVLNITVLNGSVGFSELCAKARGECVSNVLLEVIVSSEADQSSIAFPVQTHGSGSVFLGSVLGGVIAEANGSVTSAQAVKLLYHLDNKENTADASEAWLRAFKRLLSEETDGKHIDVSYYTSKSRQEEIDGHTTDGFPLFLITYACAITFSVISCLRLDNVRNKVWVAVFGVLPTGLAVLSSFGLLLYIGVPFVITVANSPFLILGIGLNNMFVMVSDWQHTNVKDPVPTRMAHSYKEAVMSITITALTDVFKFSVGVASDFPSVQSFSLYASVSIVLCYIYTITLFGAFLALNGRREASNRHWLTCKKIPSDHSDRYSAVYNICCVGGDYDKNTGAEEKHPANVNLTGDAVRASRFFIQTVDIADASTEIHMFTGLKTTAGRCRAASLSVYNQNFIFYDQYDVVVSSTIKNVFVITAGMLVVSLLLIPDPLCALWLTCSIGSVTAGVTGFMVLWNVTLTSISMIIFTICIGFTVDFSAHVSHAFASSERTSPDDKAVDALSSLGYPVLQGALSTILGMSVLTTLHADRIKVKTKVDKSLQISKL
ncbi:hypothetical protein VZT92_014072 [Zoarces viviparus]|uniref:SSD domain-containing protein n=1 Tax=Zoarces viviparus TaxID=48416 RepID=A0AAW1EZI8_ZOAVI